jgi:hypothetical protein
VLFVDQDLLIEGYFHGIGSSVSRPEGKIIYLYDCYDVEEDRRTSPR